MSSRYTLGMKRHPSLQPLSRDHHHGLVEARALRWALSGRAGTLHGARTSLLGEWSRRLAAHFDDEERWLVAFIPDAADALRLRAEHGELRDRIATLSRADVEIEPDRELLASIAERLHDHIRWEETHLFPAIEESVGASTLAALGERIAERRVTR